MESELLEKLSLDADLFGRWLFLRFSKMMHVAMAAVREAAHSGEEMSYADEDDAPSVTSMSHLKEVN